jgi:hypothetical protein
MFVKWRASQHTRVSGVLSKNGLVKGRVTAPSGYSVSGAVVFLTTTSGNAVSSSAPLTATGYYTIPAVPPGNYVAVCQPAPGTALGIQTFRNIPGNGLYVGSGMPIVVSAGATTKEINFKLQPAGILRVAAVDAATGKPVPGVTVSVVNPATGGLTQTPAVTGSDGIAFIGNVALQSKLAIVAPQGYTSFFWPNASTLKAAKVVQLTPGTPFPLTVHLK